MLYTQTHSYSYT